MKITLLHHLYIFTLRIVHEFFLTIYSIMYAKLSFDLYENVAMDTGQTDNGVLTS